jgi:hypothetical protein
MVNRALSMLFYSLLAIRHSLLQNWRGVRRVFAEPLILGKTRFLREPEVHFARKRFRVKISASL